MGNKRRERLNEQFRREISEILRTQVRDPRVGLPTVTHVEVTPDLWMARVLVRPDPARTRPGTEDAGETVGSAAAGSSEAETSPPRRKADAPTPARELLDGLEAAAPFIRRELARVLHLRRIPELRFEEDRNLEQALRIERLLNEVLPRGTEEGPEDEEPDPT